MRTLSRRWITAGLFGLTLAGTSPTALGLTVFACEPEWAALTTALAPNATVVSATHARQDPHYVEARPSLIAQLRRADLAVCTGAELETGWLPMLQQRAANAKVQSGRDGMLFTSDLVSTIHQHSHATRADGDVHPGGNPHVQLDPDRLLQIAQGLSQRLQEIDPENATDYQTNYTAWAQQWQKHTVRWKAQAETLRGRQIVAQHSSFAYLWRWLGIKQIADLEPKPGVPPTPRHLASLVKQVKQTRPIAIVQTLYQNKASVEWLHERTGIPALTLPSTITDEGEASTLSGLFDVIIQRLVAVTTSEKK